MGRGGERERGGGAGFNYCLSELRRWALALCTILLLTHCAFGTSFESGFADNPQEGTDQTATAYCPSKPGIFVMRCCREAGHLRKSKLYS